MKTPWKQLSFFCNKRKHNEYQPYRILIIENSGSVKTNSLSNLTIHQTGINKIYLCAKDSYEAKYQFLIKKRNVQA